MGLANAGNPAAASLWVLVGEEKAGVGRGGAILLRIPGRGSMGHFRVNIGPYPHLHLLLFCWIYSFASAGIPLAERVNRIRFGHVLQPPCCGADGDCWACSAGGSIGLQFEISTSVCN